MELAIEPVVHVREWSIDRIHYLSESDIPEDYLDALAIAAEFEEWLNIPEGLNELDYMCIERLED